MPASFDHLLVMFQRGGLVMYPLLLVSVVGLALIVERSWFWIVMHRASRLRMLAELNDALRRGDRAAANRLIRPDRSAYGDVARTLLLSGASDAVAVEAVEMQRPVFDRFMVVLSTIITAAPMLGILGTVTGIIQSFNLLGEQSTLTDPRVVSGGIAEALITTAFGLAVALMTLFPYMIFRGQVDRAMGRLEAIIAAGQQGDRADVGSATGLRAGDVRERELKDAKREDAIAPALPRG